MTAPTVSFVILTYRREAALRRCLESLAAAGVAGRCEALVGFNGGEPGADALIAEVARRFPWARAFASEAAPRGRARNRLIPHCRGELIYFLDDDAVVAPDFIDRLLEAMARHPEAAAFGGPNACAPDATPFQLSADAVLRSPLGAGPMRARYEASGPERFRPGWSFMLTSLGVRREAFARRGLAFPDNPASAEENLLLHRVEKAVGPLLFCPQLRAYHERRPTWGSFLSQVFVNGRGRGQITVLEPSSLQLVVLAPLALLAAAALQPRLALLYAGACVVEAARARRWRVAALIPLAHAAYAAGVLAGLFARRAVDVPAVARVLRDVRPAGV